MPISASRPGRLNAAGETRRSTLALAVVDATLDLYRSAGRALAAGVEAQAPRLPADVALREAVEREAQRDPRVARALQASIAKAERTRQLQPQRLYRDCGIIVAVR